MTAFDPNWNDPNGFSSYDEEPPDQGKIQRRLMLPAIFMIVMAGFWFLYMVFVTIMFSSGAMLRAMQQMVADADPQMQQSLQPMLNAMSGDPRGMLISNMVGLLITGITVAGGVSMLLRRFWGLALAGSILALIPCYGPCCGLTLPFGIWALIVLCNQDVKQAFA